MFLVRGGNSLQGLLPRHEYDMKLMDSDIDWMLHGRVLAENKGVLVQWSWQGLVWLFR